MLLDKGADSKAMDNSGRNCLHLCLLVQEEQEENKTDEKIIHLAKFLIKNGVDCDLEDSTGKKPVELASNKVGPQVTQLIDERKQEIQAKEEQMRRTENKRSTGSPFGQIRMNNPMTQSMYAGRAPSPFQSPLTPQAQGQAGGIRQTTPPFMTQPGQGQPRMSQSMIMTPKQGVQGQGQFTPQGQSNERPDAAPGSQKAPQACPSCDEEPVSLMLMPCEHVFCSDCAPRKKMKRKVCPECKGDVEEMIDI